MGTKYLHGFRTICYVEWDEYAAQIIQKRIQDGFLDDAPIWDNVFTFDGRPFYGLVDILSAGFPCQPFSVAGVGLGEDDPRNGWPSTFRIICEVQPRIVRLENVPGLLSHQYFGVILGQLAGAGYRIGWDSLSAKEVGAPHLRNRVWIMAYREG